MTQFDFHISKSDVRSAQVMLEYAHLTLKGTPMVASSSQLSIVADPTLL